VSDTKTSYASSVFVNCPYDGAYQAIFDAIVFAVFDCGFVPRSALEIDDGDLRFPKILKLISGSKFGIHDISRTELDANTGLPRFNMPLELGVFLGAKKFGQQEQRQKSWLILDRERRRYRDFISDLGGHDIKVHDNDPDTAIAKIRAWLSTASGRKSIPGGRAIARRYHEFEADLPGICVELEIDRDELTYNDYTNIVFEWLTP